MNRAVQEGAPNCQTMSFQLVVYSVARRMLGGRHARRRTNEWRNLTPQTWRRMADAGSGACQRNAKDCADQRAAAGRCECWWRAGFRAREFQKQFGRVSAAVAYPRAAIARAVRAAAVARRLHPAPWRQAVLPLVRKFNGASIASHDADYRSSGSTCDER